MPFNILNSIYNHIVKYIFLMNQYSMISKLGEGAFSVVYKVKRKEDGKQYAMKKMRISSLSEKEISNCLNEVRILASIENPYILSYKDSFYDELTNCFCIVTECLQGGDIFQMINKSKLCKKYIDESTIWRVAIQSLRGLQTLHSMNILHRDIKSANIFFNKDQSQIKLADMNVSIVTSNGMAKTQTGTPYYASPQVWLQKPYSAKCDIWSLGCVLYQMASLKPPFISPDIKSLKKTIMSGIYKRIPLTYSNDLENFIRLCLKTDPKDRLSATGLLETQLLNKRLNLLKQTAMSQSITISSSLSRKLIQRILPPKKRDFKSIKDRLPKNKFESSVDKISQNKSTYFDDKNKQNIRNLDNSSKNLSKEPLPAIRRSVSMKIGQDKYKVLIEKVIACEERPPLPKKQLRA